MRKALLLIFLGICVAGCCHQRRTYPAPPVTILIDAVQKRNGAASSLRAKVKADQLTPKGRVKLTVFLLVRQGGKLRFEATVLDNTVAVLTSDGQSFASIDYKNHMAYQGPASPCNIARIFNIPLSGQQVAVVLMGGVPVLHHDSSRVHWDRCKGLEVLTLSHRRHRLTQRIYMRYRGDSWIITQARVSDAKGRDMLKVSFSGFRKRKNIWVPRWIHFEQPQQRADVRLRFIKQEVGVEIPDDAFRLENPSQLPVRWLTCPDERSLPFMDITKALPSSPVTSTKTPFFPF